MRNNKSNYCIKSPAMHYKGNFRTLLFTFACVSCIIVASCSNDSPKTDSDAHDFSAEKRSVLSNVNNDTTTSRDHFSSRESAVRDVILEGGSTVSVNSDKNNDMTTSRKSVPNDSLNGKTLELESPHYAFNDSNSSDKKPHKGRKGVIDVNSEETSIDPTTFNVLKTTESKKEGEELLNNVFSRTAFTVINSTVNSTTESSFNLPNSQVVKQTPADNVNKSSIDNAGSSGLKNGTNQNIIPENKSNLAEEHSSPRPKPGVTILDHDVDHSSYSLTSTETDYVIPIVATIFAAPLLIVLGMLLYKRSKEFWERRHYRRMDFLIDGMYND